MKTETVGFVGVGLMGHGMAKSLLAAGYPVTVIAHTNRKPVDEPRRPWRDRGSLRPLLAP